MWDAVGNDDRVTFSNVMLFAAFNPASADLIRRNRFRVDCFPACDQSGRTVDHVNDIRVERVDFSLAGIDATAGVNFVARSFEQWHSFGERSGNLLAVDEGRCLCSLHGWVLRT